MKSIHGLLHKTTLQAAQEQRPVPQTASTTGLKRTWSTAAASDSSQQDPLAGHVRFQRATSLPVAEKRLSASKIVDIKSDEGVSEYSQRLQFAATPTARHDPELSLAYPIYGLPSDLVQNFAKLGITQIYPWQKNCLKGPGLLSGARNLVYCAPTGGGKSLVADLLMLKRTLEKPGSKSLLVLPYVALVQEKVRWLRNLVQGLQAPGHVQRQDDAKSVWQPRADEGTVRVVGFFGGGKVRATWDDFDIGVCTFEKANTLINTAIEDCSIASLRCVVLDELHMIDDGHRGYLLEFIASKLLSLEQSVQIVGMSATLPNKDIVASWLNSHSYETLYRPVPIEEHLVYNGSIYAAASTRAPVRTATQLTQQGTVPSQLASNPLRKVTPSAHKEFSDPTLNAVVALALETALSGFGALVFAGSRAMCESDAKWISRVMPDLSELPIAMADKRIDLLSKFRSLSTGLDPVLEETVLRGVAFHHAGLTSEERDLVASAYDDGALLICVATCSLAAGINLPARRVILHTARMGRDFVGPALLRQMRGRAGRQGRAPVGETYLCCRENELEQVVNLMHADLPNVSSCLTTENRRVQRALLEVVTVRLATSEESIREYFDRSFLRHTREPEFLVQCIRSSLDELQSIGLVAQDNFSNFAPTQLGKAVVASAIDPDDGIFIHRELSRALKAFVMDGEMHLLYTFTPVQDFGVHVNWQIFLNELESLDDSGLRVIRFLGIQPTKIVKLAQGAYLKETTEAERDEARVYRRFYLAFQLRDLCNEMPVHVVSRKYDQPRGLVQNLSQTCQGFAAGMIKFCEQMGWGVMGAALDHFSERLMAGARAELLSLAKIAFIKSRTARVFWENGFRTVGSIANASPQELLPVLLQAQPNKIRVKNVDSEKYKEKLIAKAEVISASANKLWRIEKQADMEEE